MVSAIDHWKRAIFLDEAKFKLFGLAWHIVRLENGERYCSVKNVSTNKYPPYVMIWGCIKSARVGLIIFLRSFISAIKYIGIVNAALMLIAQEVLTYHKQKQKNKLFK